MAGTSRTFEIRTEPHEAIIGPHTLLLEPEVVGTEFATAYATLREVQRKVKGAQASKGSSTKHAKGDGLNAERVVRAVAEAHVRYPFMIPCHTRAAHPA